MHRFPRPLLATAGWLLLFAGPIVAASSQDPLRFVSDKTDLVVKVDNPRKLIEAVTALEAFKQAEKLDAVQQFFDTPQARRIFEFIAYYERDLGAKWPELLDKLAGGGMVLSAKIKDGMDDPVLLAIQATDEALLAKFVERAVAAIEQEMARNESKDKVSREKYQDFETLHIGKDLHACRLGSALLVSNKPEALKAGIDQHFENMPKRDRPAKNMLNSPSYERARKLLPANPLVSLYYGFNYLKGRQEAKNLLTDQRENTTLTFLAAGVLDVVRRSDFVMAGILQKSDGFSLSVRMPAGRDGMAEDVELHLPRDAKVSGSLPLLEPKGVIFSHSFYLDLGTFWTKREKIMNAMNAKDFETAVKNASRFLPGTSVDKLLVQSGVHHRFVVANAGNQGYKVEPKVKLPPFAYVGSMRDESFGKSLQSLIRAGAFLASTQVSLKLFEDKHGEVPLFGYRFPEDGKFPDDPQNLRFNFTPTFAAVKDQFIAASSVELCKELIDLIQKEDRAKPITQNLQMRLYAKGGGDFLSASSEAILTQTILSQAIPEAEAKRQVEELLKFVRNLGVVRIETDYTAKDFRFDIEWKFR
jgi:hypothetical protein